MKRTFKRPDGTDEVVEGTAEELAEYERRLRNEPVTEQRKPPVLKGTEVDGVPLTEEELGWVRLLRQMKPVTLPVQPTFPDWGLQGTWCVYCQRYGCNQTHITCGTATLGGGGILS